MSRADVGPDENLNRKNNVYWMLNIRIIICNNNNNNRKNQKKILNQLISVADSNEIMTLYVDGLTLLP